MTRVTEILGYFQEPQLVDWRIRVGNKEARRISTMTAKTGTRVHELIYNEWKEGMYKLKKADSLEVRNCMQGWEQFKKDYSPTIHNMEYEVMHEVESIVGHIDMLATIGIKKCIIDIKTSGNIRSKHWLQLGAYYSLASESSIEEVAVLRLDRNLGLYELESNNNPAKLSDVFFSLWEVYKFYNGPNGAEEMSNADNSRKAKDSPTN